jgi:hypothetical protein
LHAPDALRAETTTKAASNGGLCCWINNHLLPLWLQVVSLTHLKGDTVTKTLARKLLLAILMISSTVFSLASKSRKDVPEAPMPAAIANAKKVFITNGGGSNLAFDEFYSDIKTWNRFELVGSPSAADVIFELRYVVEDKGTHVWSSTNSYTGATQVYSNRIVDPQLSINFYDAKTKDLLWSVTDHRRLAKLEKNREKETINSADRLVQNIRDRIGVAPALQQ